MNYRYATESANYEDFAAGRVLRTYSGMTAFPVRLTSELFQRGAAYLPARPLRVWDPCCGSGALLTVLGFLHAARLESLWASDFDREAVALARKNLALLTPAGLQARQREIEVMQAAYGKESHDEARRSVEALRARLPDSPIACAAWVGDALEQTLPPH
ncbi:MAG: rRNA methyltransferase, partial [Anaerolineae bacterium]|nr:rRNA methyltransferase [Anaerolineae bacterium]